MSEAQNTILTHAVIPDFALVSPSVQAPSRDEYLIAEFARRFDAHRVESDELPMLEAEPENYGGEPEWERFGFRGQVGKLLWARGLQKKAIRFVSCNKCARPGVCSRYPDEHKYFIPNGCEVVFCPQCASEVHHGMFMDYWHVLCNSILDFASECAARREDELLGLLEESDEARREKIERELGSLIGARFEHERLCDLLAKSEGAERKKIERELGELWLRVGRVVRREGWVLARINFTLRADGSEITPERVKKFNACVRKVVRRTVGSKSGCGVLFADEVGFESCGHLPDAQRVAHGLNLHCHGIYFGPWKVCRESWERTRDLWMAETREAFGVESRGFYIKVIRDLDKNPGRAIRLALRHLCKYLQKPPAVTAERLASLIAAFDGARRVHSLGLFYGKKPQRKAKDCLCPKCKAAGVVSVVGFEGRSLPNGGCIPRLEQIEVLLSRGYVPLREAGRVAVLSMGGESPP